jgi:hypothetical protein
MSDQSGLAVPMPKLAPTADEVRAVEEVVKKVKQSITPERLAQLQAMGKQDEPIVVAPVVPADQLKSAIAQADAALRDAGFIEGRRRMHRNRE